jgi:hypothetical protein
MAQGDFLFSLTPGFSRVRSKVWMTSRFNGFVYERKPLKRFYHLSGMITGLKPGVNERFNYTKMNLAEKVRHAGVVGAGGARGCLP